MPEQSSFFTDKHFVAKTISGLEEVLAAELTQLGASEVTILNRAVSFSGDERLLYKANYWSRTALRILVPVFSFQLADEDDLYSTLRDYPWEDLIDVTQTLAIDAVVSESQMTHSHYVALRSKDAIVDRFRERFNGRRPSVDVDDPDLRINIHIFGSQCDVSLDSSGISLHKRGYRVSNAEAPMSEVLAAGLILLSGWDKQSNFIDPMCGSGTLLIEAALIANNFPPGMYRKSYGFMKWKHYTPSLWDEVLDEAQDLQTEFEGEIIGNDISPRNLGAAKANIKSARLHKDIQLHTGPFSELQAPEGEPGILVINPPYGERIKTSDIIGLYREIGDTLKKNFTGFKAWVISSDHYALKSVGLKAFKKVVVWNGPLECRFAGFDLYEGTRKQRIEAGEENEKEEYSGDEKSTAGMRKWEEPEGSDHGDERPFQKADQPDKPQHHERETGSSGRSYKSREREDKPFRKDDRREKPFSRDRKSGDSDRPFKPRDRDDKPYRKDDRGDKPFSRDRKSGDSDRPFKSRDRDDKPFRSSRKDESRSKTHSDHESTFPDKKSTKKTILEYSPENRYSKPEKTYHRKDGKVNEGDPSGSKVKQPKNPRPRKPKKGEE